MHSYTVNDMVDGSGALYRINRDQVEAIGIALLYGQKEIASKKDEQTLRYEKLCRHAAKDVDTIITDSGLPASIERAIRMAGSELVIVP